MLNILVSREDYESINLDKGTMKQQLWEFTSRERLRTSEHVYYLSSIEDYMSLQEYFGTTLHIINLEHLPSVNVVALSMNTAAVSNPRIYLALYNKEDSRLTDYIAYHLPKIKAEPKARISIFKRAI